MPGAFRARTSALPGNTSADLAVIDNHGSRHDQIVHKTSLRIVAPSRVAMISGVGFAAVKPLGNCIPFILNEHEI